MDNQRLFLYLGLVFLGLLIWQQWELDYGVPPAAVEDRARPAPAGSTAEDAGDAREIPDAPPAAAPVSRPQSTREARTPRRPRAAMPVSWSPRICCAPA